MTGRNTQSFIEGVFSVATLISEALEYRAQLTDHDVNQALLKEIVAQFVETEQKRATAHAEVLALSRIDGLTGIANRRRFNEQLNADFSRAQRNTSKLGLLMLDIDCFKLYNDNYGHAAGDDCLRLVANIVKSNVRRAGDLAARFGGEEIVCLFPETDIDGVSRVGRSILKDIRKMSIPHLHSTVSKIVTVSIGGVALVPTTDMTPTNIVEAADKLLYAAKRKGRNRLMLDE